MICRINLSGTQWQRLTFVLIGMFCAGCSNHIRKLPETAEIKTPETWQAQTVKDSVASVDNWLTNFDDAQLSKHVQTALLNNPDLMASAAQLKSSIEQVRIVGAGLWPAASVAANSNKNKTRTNDLNNETRSARVALDISWEADIWGKLSQQKKAALFSAQAQNELFNAVQLSLAANVSRAWFNLITSKLQRDLAQQRLDSFQRTADLIDENYQTGLRSALDVYLSRSDVQLQQSRLSDAKFDYLQVLRAFRTLLGQYPDTELEFTTGLPTIKGAIPLGLPADLLTRRPDIRAGQLSYQAQIANAKAVHRARYPKLSFSGSIGDSRDRFSRLFENSNLVTSLLGGVIQPVFRAGELQSREKQAVYQAEVTYAQLLKSTLSAFEEVENAVSQEQALMTQHGAIEKAVDYAQSGLDLALDRYQSGIENYATVLQAQRRLFDLMQSEINLRNALLQNRINVYLALGGNFDTTRPQ